MPSEKVLQSKKEQVAQIVEAIKGATTGVLVDYRGLSVEEDTKLRNDLRAAGVQYFVVKNTLLRFAAKETGLDGLDEILHGPTALALSEDAVAPAKVLADYAKQNEKMEIKSGFMEGKVLAMDELMQLAKTPNKETLIAKLMGSLNSPISGLARLLNTVVDGGVEIEDLIAKKAGEATDAPVEETAEAAEVAAPAEETVEAPAEEAATEEKAEVAEEATEEPAAEVAEEASTDAE